MNFSDLTEYLEKLEGTSSRLEMTRILAELFGRVDPEEGKVIAYLSAGMLGPKYNNPDTGMAEKQAIKAVAEGLGLETVKVTEAFKKSGDLGKTVEDVSVSVRVRVREMTVAEVHRKLLEIAGTAGEGSQERKIRLTGELLAEVSGKEGKYVIKILLGKMRSGCSDMTVLDALAWMKTGNKSLRPVIEKIYNVRADLGEVVRLVCSHGDISGIRVDPKIGTPILVARGERAKSAQEIWDRLGRPSASSGRQQAVAAEHKLDGLRIQAHVKKDGVQLFSRGMENVTAMYPDITAGLSRQVKEEGILDGEMIAVGEDGKYRPFQETVQRKRKYDISAMAVKVPLKYYVFDVLWAEGKSWLDQPNEDRWRELEKIVSVSGRVSDDTVRLMPRIIVKSVEEIEKFFRAAIAEGTEGIFVKKLSGTYQSGSRDFNWIKYKKSYDETGAADTIDAVVMGYDVGQGKRSGFGIGGFLIGVNAGKTGRYQTIAKIGTGLTDEEWKQLKVESEKVKAESKPEEYDVGKQMECDVWVRPKMVAEIKADEITKSPMHTSGYALRFPRLVGFRK